jgi:uncharacterized protein YndB with AHSA1/START domain
MTTATTPEVQTTQVYQVFIKASPERIWEALTKPELVKLYYHNCRLESEVQAGGRWRAWSPDHTKLWVDAEILEFDPPRRLAHGWRSLYKDELAAEPESRVTWEIEPQEGGYSLVTVVHDLLENSPKTAAGVSGVGWMHVLSGLKTVLETGKPLSEDELR